MTLNNLWRKISPNTNKLILSLVLVLSLTFGFLSLQAIAQTANSNPTATIFTQQVTFDGSSNLENVFNNLKAAWNNPTEKNLSVVLTADYKLSTLNFPINLEVRNQTTLSKLVTSFNNSKNQLIDSLKQTIAQKQAILNQQTPTDSYGVDGSIRFSAESQMQDIAKTLTMINQLEGINLDQFKQTSFTAKQITVSMLSVNSSKPTVLFENLAKTYKQTIENKSNSQAANAETKLETKNRVKNSRINTGEFRKARNSLAVTKINQVISEETTIAAQAVIGESIKPQIIKFTSIKNVNSINSQAQQAKIEAEIKAETEKALQHNRQVRQTYNDYEKKILQEAGFDPSTNFNTKKSPLSSALDIVGKVITGPQVSARGLNNSTNDLLIYSWDNSNFTLDLNGNNRNNGGRFNLWQRNGTSAQFFRFDNGRNEIKLGGKCLDIAGSNFNNGTQVQIWDCNGTGAQKWYFDGVALVAMANNNFCLDIQAGSFNNGTKVQIWKCNGSSAQKWVAGSNNFGANHTVSIHASDTGKYANGLDVGHVFLSYKINGQVVNTQSSWPNNPNKIWEGGNDWDCNNNNRFNNICDGDAAFVDNNNDWDYANNIDGKGANFKAKTEQIPKRISDVYRFNSGYRWKRVLGNIEYTGVWQNNFAGNCATFSRRVWNDIMTDTGKSLLYPENINVPGSVRKAL